MAIPYNCRSTFEFIGDSITDSGRASDPEGIGYGYLRVIRDYLRAHHPEIAPVISNRGESGSVLTDWLGRFRSDATAQRPDVVSIFFDLPAPTADPVPASNSSIDEFRAVFRQLLNEITKFAPRCKLVLCEPAAFWSSASFEADQKLRPYFHAILTIAEEVGASAVVPIHSGFVHLRQCRPDISWMDPEGRPTSSGHAVIAYTWLEATGLSTRTPGQ